MKRKLLLMLVFIPLLVIEGQAQMINGDFSVNMGNCNNCLYDCFNINNNGMTGTPTVLEGTGFPNWYITHGTPQFTTETEYPNDLLLAYEKTDGINNNDIRNTAVAGEGMAGGYNFIAGETYTITVGFRNSTSVSAFHLALVDGARPRSTDCDNTPCPDLRGVQGVRQVITMDDIYTERVKLLTLSGYGAGNNSVTFTASRNYNWVWIYAEDPNESCENWVVVSNVYVEKKCKEDLYLPAAMIGSGYYTSYKRIHAGSSHGSAANMSLINAATTLEGTETVFLDSGLTIEPGNGIFMATINPYACDYSPSDIQRLAAHIPPLNTDYAGWKTLLLPNETIETVKVDEMKLYPNPSNDVVNIVLPENMDIKNSTITICRPDGTPIQTFSVTDNEMIISLKQYPTGLYMLKVNTPNATVSRNLVKL